MGGAFAAALCLLASLLAHYAALNGFLDELSGRGRRILDLATATLETDLQRYRSIPNTISAFREFHEADLAAAGASDATDLSRLLERVADASGLRDLYLLDETGLTIAASNWNTPRSFMGQRYDYRPYFTEAMDHGQGRYFALGSQSQERGFYYSARVDRRQGGPLVIVAKVLASGIESAWGDAGVISAVDRHGVIFMSNRPALRLRALRPLDAESREILLESRQYLDRPLEPAPDYRILSYRGYRVLRPMGEGWLRLGVEGSEFLILNRALASADLRVELLLDTKSARQGALVVSLLAALGVMLVSVAMLALWQRRRAAEMKLELEAAAKEDLEIRVEERTRALSDTNLRLEREVGERRAAEQALRRTQDELVQAGKLSALGQLSAGVSHELNQPLGAIRAYAENAVELLKRDRRDEASDNLDRIARLTSRMARIVSNLRTFARREDQAAGPVRLVEPLGDAIQILQQRLEKEGAVLRVENGAPEAWVLGGAVRLQQVFMNILSNALDAVRGRETRRISVAIAEQSDPSGDWVVIRIHDTGPGVAPEARDRLFDPYFTTKSAGEGMGIGLSISYGIISSFGGRIAVETHPEGGAVFTLRFKRSEPAVEATAADEREEVGT